MRFQRAIIVLALLMTRVLLVAENHPVPRSRNDLKAGDWLPYVFSKIAPMEWWSFSASPADIKRKHYPDDSSFRFAQQNTGIFPRFCFSMFRPAPEKLQRLYQLIGEYKGDGVTWQLYDQCIGAFPAGTNFYVSLGNPDGSSMDPSKIREMMENAAKNPPHADPVFVQKAMQDLPKFGAWLEKQLDLEGEVPQQFDPQWLTREGLVKSRGVDEDFYEPGAWSVVLSPHPDEVGRSGREGDPAERSLSMSIGMSENDALFKELAPASEASAQGSDVPALPKFPLMSRLSDITEDTIYQPGEIDALLEEYLRAQSQITDPRALRGIDKLIRIARFAQKLKMGIYFGGDD